MVGHWYWLASAYNVSAIWYVCGDDGTMYGGDLFYNGGFHHSGVRPVITVLRSNIS